MVYTRLLKLNFWAEKMVEPAPNVRPDEVHRAKLFTIITFIFSCVFGTLLLISATTGVFVYHRPRFFVSMLLLLMAHFFSRTKYWLQSLRTVVWSYTMFSLVRTYLWRQADPVVFAVSHIVTIINSVLIGCIGLPFSEILSVLGLGTIGTFLIPVFNSTISTSAMLEFVLGLSVCSGCMLCVVFLEIKGQSEIRKQTAELSEARDAAIKLAQAKSEFAATMARYFLLPGSSLVISDSFFAVVPIFS